jgi:alpha-L-fucosidase 2
MTLRNTFLIIFSFVVFVVGALSQQSVDRYNVVWDSPSDDSFGSMPLGNGDVGMNVWVEKSGDLLFYISKVDVFEAGHQLPKLGRIRISAEPRLPVTPFRQTLSLIDASIRIQAGDASFKIWVDANHPVIRIEGDSKTARSFVVRLETIRPLTSRIDTVPTAGTVGFLFNDGQNRLTWCYRNYSSVWADNIKKQNTPELIARIKDPLLNRTSGCVIEGKSLVRHDATTLASNGKLTSLDCTIRVNSSQPEDLQAWLSQVLPPIRSNWKAHAGYWKSFWDRSYIHVTSGGEGTFDMNQARFTNAEHDSKIYEGVRRIDAGRNVFQISQRYALERFCEAAASRGAVPPPFNGSIFTTDMPAGTHMFIERGTRTEAVNADNRDWQGLPFFWQNTRHPYWSMLARGDYDAMMSGFRVVRGALDVCEDRCKNLFKHDGAYMNEGMFWKGVSVFNDLPKHLTYHFMGTVEMTAMMCDYFEHTQDKKFLREVLLPCADKFIQFYELHFPVRDSQGKMIMEPAGVVETYQPVTNPVTEVSGLRYLVSKLLSMDQALIGKHRAAHWSRFFGELPEVPRRTIRGIELLAPGSTYSGRLICEAPELYAVWPFQQASLGNSSFLANARQSFHVRQVSLDGTSDEQSWETGGWQSTPIWAAYLGLPREAARLVSINFDDRLANYTFKNPDMVPPDPNHPRPRFPGFWETKFDYTPDNDHGGTSANGLQSMLLQSDGRTLYVLPAWPENWDVSFKLHAALNTTVECAYRDGKVQSLKVTPQSRRADIVDMSNLRERIRTLVSVALADRNYLFGLPPMLDAELVKGKTTGAWVSKYGSTLAGCKAGPWSWSVFKGKTAYVHILDWPSSGDFHLRAIPRKLVSSESITGKVSVRQDASGWALTGTPDTLDTIVKMEFDQPLDEIALGLPSDGSHTAGRTREVQTTADGRVSVEVKLDGQKTIERFEFTIGRSEYQRGDGKPFEFQIRDASGEWTTAYQGKVFGTIFGRRIDSVKASAVRLVIQNLEGAGLKQFDVF